MGNCLDKNYSSSEESDERDIISGNESTTETRRNRFMSSSSSNRYTSLVEEMSNSSASLNRSQNGQNRYSNHLNVSRREASSRELGVVNSPSLNNYLSQSYGGHTTQSSLGLSGLSSSFPSTTALGASAAAAAAGATSSQQVVYLTPNTQRTVDQLTEEEQVKLLKRMTLIQQLPTGSFDENKKHKECVICMIDFEKNDTIKYLPCMHTFHQSCIDTWLLRSLICPSCMEPVDAGLLAAYE